MSSTAKFLQLQYELGRVTAEQLQGITGKKITEEEYNEITRKERQIEQ